MHNVITPYNTIMYSVVANENTCQIKRKTKEKNIRLNLLKTKKFNIKISNVFSFVGNVTLSETCF